MCKATAYWSRTGLKSWDQSLRYNRQKLCVLNCVWLFATLGFCVHLISVKNTGGGCHSSLLGIFLTQQLNPALQHLLQIDRQILTTELSGKPLRCNRLSSNPSLPKGWEEGRKAEINPSKVALQIFSECTVAALLKPLQFWCLLRTLQWCFKGLNVD